MTLASRMAIFTIPWLSYICCEFIKMKYPLPLTGEIMPGLMWKFNFSKYNERPEMKIPKVFETISTIGPKSVDGPKDMDGVRERPHLPDVPEPKIESHERIPLTSITITTFEPSGEEETSTLSEETETELPEDLKNSQEDEKEETSQPDDEEQDPDDSENISYTTLKSSLASTSISNPRFRCSRQFPHGRWSEWKTHVECTAECGSCGLLQRTRRCLSFVNGTGCPCVGEYKITEPCNIEACSYPKPACCPPYVLVYLDGYFTCGPHEKAITDRFLEQKRSWNDAIRIANNVI